jgi:carboxypeptidase PM20D1
VPGVEKPVALIATSEKGGVTLKLSVNIPGGHSSFPGKATSIDVLAKALYDLRSHPFPPDIAPSLADFIEYVSPEMPFHQKLVMGNSWLFKPLIYNIYSQTPMGDACIRTTMVPTIINAGVKSNVVPTIATASVNFRNLPGTSIDEVIAHTQKAINNDQVKISVMPVPREATFTSSPDSMGFQAMMSPVKHHFDDAIVSPFILIGGTDSRHFKDITPNIYRFSPMIDPIGFHGVDEQLKISDYSKTIGFYHEFILNL